MHKQDEQAVAALQGAICCPAQPSIATVFIMALGFVAITAIYAILMLSMQPGQAAQPEHVSRHEHVVVAVVNCSYPVHKDAAAKPVKVKYVSDRTFSWDEVQHLDPVTICEDNGH